MGLSLNSLNSALYINFGTLEKNHVFFNSCVREGWRPYSSGGFHVYVTDKKKLELSEVQ